jgi:hypothetical protein
LVELVDADNALLAKLNEIDGRSTENLRWINILQEQYRASGGPKAVEVLSAQEVT